ncbi:hypothetical protein RLEG12_21655 [Rhizobium leguminosarum bv. trifolii CB782]|uniref:hypothetical protein n=1 Tax=Rhizobium hidalgonense TaxID=1538159 RepID=UPI0003E2D4DD|nr:hypothetical protein [Rhizobium hidalgonense]AHG47925.1 hypothetical protein RLEG12_21655 [Rhizobium leguminosarum bv. trifolii CB782]RWX07454.1 hypothetical protein EHI42_30210 [Rhizobium hidalgonense]
MMRRTMVLTQRQARFENHSKAAFCNANSDISICRSRLLPLFGADLIAWASVVFLSSARETGGCIG